MLHFVFGLKNTKSTQKTSTKTSKSKHRNSQSSRRLNIENLESREMLSIYWTGAHGSSGVGVTGTPYIFIDEL